MLKILLVDDEEININIFKDIFEKQYELLAVSSGEEAIESIEHFKPDIILLDIMMSGIDGYEVCRKIRANDNLSFIKIILVSAKVDLQDRLKGYEVGADDYIVKPFDEGEIVAKIKVLSKMKYIEEVDQIKNGFLQAFSREKNAPLRDILGFATLLSQHKFSSYEDQVSVEGIIERSHQLLKFSRNVKLLCQLKGDFSLSAKLEDVNVLMSKIVQDMQLKFSNSSVSFFMSGEVGCEVFLDLDLFRKSVIYVIENSIQRSPKNGVVTIALEECADMIIIKIQDQGDSIPDDDAEKIFDEFVCFDSKRKKKGDSLGLVLAGQIMKLHKGSLSVCGYEGGGSIFQFDLSKILST